MMLLMLKYLMKITLVLEKIKCILLGNYDLIKTYQENQILIDLMMKIMM